MAAKHSGPSGREDRDSWRIWRPAILGICTVILVPAAVGVLSGNIALGRRTVLNGGQDFGIIYRSVRQYQVGRSLYDPEDARNGRRGWWGRNLNLPHTHIPLLPLTALPPSAPLWVWLGVSLLALADTGRRTIRETKTHFPWVGALTVAVYLLAWAPMAAMVLTFQVSLLVMWMVAVAWLAARRGAWTAAGLWIGLAASVKPFLLLCLPYFAIRRQWTAFRCAVGAGAGMLTLGIGVFGVESYRQWLRQLGEISWGAHYMNASIMGVLERWIGRSSGYAPILRAPSLVVPVGIVAGATVVVLTLRRIGRGDHSPSRIDNEWAVWLLASLLASPLGWIYYFWLPLPPLVLVSVRASPWARRRSRDLLWLFGVAGLLWFASMTVWGQPSPLATVTLASTYFWALAALWVWTLRETRGERPLLPSSREPPS